MNLRRELLLAVGVLVVLNLALAFGSIGLFVRMGPAIERILNENVYSIVAAEEILLELSAAGDEPLREGSTKLIEQALSKMEKNVTEPEERPALLQLRISWPSVKQGDIVARSDFAVHLRTLLTINRTAMEMGNSEAKRLGRAGAWSSVLVGFVTFLLSLIVLARLERRFVIPLLDLHQVLEGARKGERLRRCKKAIDAPREVLQLTQAVNTLLDERFDYSRAVPQQR